MEFHDLKLRDELRFKRFLTYSWNTKSLCLFFSIVSIFIYCEKMGVKAILRGGARHINFYLCLLRSTHHTLIALSASHMGLALALSCYDVARSGYRTNRITSTP